MKEFIIGLTAIYFLLFAVIYIIGALSAFHAEWGEIDRLIAYSLPSEKTYWQIRNRLVFLEKFPFKSRKKMDELTKVFIKKFKYQVYIDFELSQTRLFKRLVRLTA